MTTTSTPTKAPKIPPSPTLQAGPATPSETAHRPGGNLAPKGRGIAMVILVFASFMDLLDATVAQVALPAIQHDLHATPTQLEWVPTAYMLAFAVLLVTGGRLGDALGRRHAFLIGIGGFALASLAASLAPDGTVLIASRIAQGAFAGIMVPQALSTLQALYSPKERAPMLGVFGAISGLAAMVGPVLGGALVSANLFGSQWRSVFLINVPVGVILFVLAIRLVPNTRSKNPVRFDPLSIALAAAGVFGVMFALIEGRSRGWDAWSWGVLVAGLVVLACFVLRQISHESRGAVPLVPMSLFRTSGFTFGLITQLFFQGAMNALTIVFFIYVQAGLGFTAIAAGLTALPFSIGAIIGTGISVPLGARFGKGMMFVGGATQVAAVMWLATVVAHEANHLTGWNTLLPFGVAGVGLGLLVVPLVDVALARVPLASAGAATGAYSTFQQIGAALGIAVVGLVFYHHVGANGLPIDISHAFVNSTWVAVIGYGVCALTSLLLPGPAAVRIHKTEQEADQEAEMAGD